MSGIYLSEFERGPRDEHGEHYFNQERLERDFVLTQRVQAGYTPAEPTDEKPRPRIIDGNLDEDGQAAVGELWAHYQPAAQKIANKLGGLVQNVPGLDKGDLTNEGFFGMYHAALRWHPQKRITFLTQANSYMRGYMLRMVSDMSTTVRLPEHERENVRRLNSAIWTSYRDTEHLPGRAVLSKILGISVSEVDRLLQAEALSHQMGSIDVGYFEDDRDKHSIYGKRPDSEINWKPIDPGAEEQKRVEDEVILTDLAKLSHEVLGEGGLDEYESEVLRLLFFGTRNTALSREEVAKHMGTTRNHVRQIEVRAFAKVRRAAYESGSIYKYLAS